ncbi:MAG: hypothetical protein Q8Q08_13015 [Candidatus Omnitrophota bacterium]|nr:hypothetical protein [Candidatus Omnitrophota bacterium]
MKLEVPGLPPTLNAMNRSVNRYARTATKDEWRARYGWALRAAKWKRLRTPIAFYVLQYSRRERDADALSITAKFMLDAIVDAGLLPDDGPRYVRKLVLVPRKAAKGEPERTVFIAQEPSPSAPNVAL